MKVTAPKGWSKDAKRQMFSKRLDTLYNQLSRVAIMYPVTYFDRPAVKRIKQAIRHEVEFNAWCDRQANNAERLA